MIPGGTQTFRLGDVTITILDVYGIPETLGKLIPAPAEERTAEDEVALARTEELPVQCILVRAPGGAVLVDAGDYEAEFDGAKRVNFNPPDLLERLAAIGVAPGDVEHVVITHAHGDHYNRLTIERGGSYEVAFPNARCYLGKGDWDDADRQARVDEAGSLDARTLGVVNQAGRLVAVAGDLDLVPGVSILAAPGETAGHQVLRVRSAGQTLYCIGDLYHHPVEVVHPNWMVPWANAEANLQSRRSIAEAALAENALLVATHIRGVGRLERTVSGVRWVEVAEV